MTFSDVECRQKRAALAKKIIAICPHCKTPIQGQYVFNSKGFSNKYETATCYPFEHKIECPHNHNEKLILYFDANLSVRDLISE